MVCERCGQENDGRYGSGRFCNSRCAHSFSTREKREEINRAVSRTLKGRPGWGGNPFKSGVEWNGKPFTQEERLKGSMAFAESRRKIHLTLKFEQLPESVRREKILEEQGGKCLFCGLSEWMGRHLVLELDHIDGDHSNNARHNQRILCPNCHSQTPTYRNRRRQSFTERGQDGNATAC